MQETGYKWSKGDWVFHPRMPGWGYGKILELIGNKKGRVLFLLAGEKKLSWEHTGLGLVEGDDVSHAALDNQLAEYKVNLAKDLLTSEALTQEVTCTPSGSFRVRCELCQSASNSLRIYSLAQKEEMCLCDLCRDKIMLETRERTEINKIIKDMEKRSKKEAAEQNKKKKLKRAK